MANNPSPAKQREPQDPFPNPFVALTAAVPQFFKSPRKWHVSVQADSKLAEAAGAVAACVQALGIGNPKLPEALLVLGLEACEGIIAPGFLGSQRPAFETRLNEMFGAGKWSFAHLIGKRLLDPSHALALYVQAYVNFFSTESGAAVAAEVTRKYRDVIDTAPTNVESGFDFSKQERPDRGHHLHDIAIRRALHELGYQFNPQAHELLQVRGAKSAGAVLSPGVVPFHRPQLIGEPPSPRKQWWQPGSVEDFYQTTRRVIVYEFTGDERSPLDAESGQRGSQYERRVAARMLLRTLPLFCSPCADTGEKRVSLAELNELPWMVDHNSFPLGPAGLPRQFSDAEVAATMRAALEQLEGLFMRKGNPRDPLLLGQWVGFDRARCLVEAVERVARDGPGSLSEVDIKNFPDLVEMETWGGVLPYFWRHVVEQGARPLFLARDGLAVMEYLAYRCDLAGRERAEVQRSVYVPGNRNRHLEKNQRSDYPPLEMVVQKLFEFSEAAYLQCDLGQPPNRAEEVARVHAGFKAMVCGFFEQARVKNPADLERQAYEVCHGLYDDIVALFDGDLRKVVIVDSDGTGKTVLFVATLLEYFSAEAGEVGEIGMVVGGLQKRHLGVPSLAAMHNFTPDARTGTTLPDIRWPFRFAELDPSPTFLVRQTPAALLGLLWRSLKLYNFAVRDERP